MMLSSTVLVISVFPNSRAFDPARYVAECTGDVVGSTSLIWCFAVAIVPRCLSHMDSNSGSLFKKRSRYFSYLSGTLIGLRQLSVSHSLPS